MKQCTLKRSKVTFDMTFGDETIEGMELVSEWEDFVKLRKGGITVVLCKANPPSFAARIFDGDCMFGTDKPQEFAVIQASPGIWAELNAFEKKNGEVSI